MQTPSWTKRFRFIGDCAVIQPTGILRVVTLLAHLTVSIIASGDEPLLRQHCLKCHSGKKPKGDFDLKNLLGSVNKDNIDWWVTSLDYVSAGEMPPAKASRLSEDERDRMVRFLQNRVAQYDQQREHPLVTGPRRLNNRELANSLADVLLIEDVGTHEPLANLLGDTLADGFDTNGDALGMSEFHLEQYLEAFRRVIDGTILTGERPKTRTIDIPSDALRISDLSNRRRSERANRTDESIEILDIRKHAYFSNFEEVAVSGRYRIAIRAAGIDRNVYRTEDTGHYQDDPIRLRIHLGTRTRDFDLPDEEIATLELDEWLAAGTRIRISYLTDALRLRGNGNFKFQYRIAHDYIKENNPQLYQRVVNEEIPKAKTRRTAPEHWVHWTGYWQGPRPRLFDARVVGPIYESWPPRRQQVLLGEAPDLADAEKILTPIARRAWRREVRAGELSSVIQLVQARAESIGTVAAFKEGILAILASPSFLLIDPEHSSHHERFATKLSFFLQSTTPDHQLREASAAGQLQSYAQVLSELQRQLKSNAADEFLNAFPAAWLQLDRINFMAPDPDRFPMYDRKRLSEDMVGEVLHFFRRAVKNNVPVPELLSADYSFVNADLARVYDISNVPPDSQFRKYTFADGRRGGLLGMGAFLTLTADSLGTSPIHRAVYVMENFMGIHPEPPPGDVEISEPDVRQAKTIKEILSAHRADARCASCHQSIDPYGYAFENFDPVGAWRTGYTSHLIDGNNRGGSPIPIDASATFRNGKGYRDIREFRKLLQSDANRERFVRCFVKKLLTYANGVAPEDYSAVQRIVDRSAEHQYRIVETIAAVIDSELFRETQRDLDASPPSP